MMLDKRSVELLLRLPDEQLVAIVRRLAYDAGVDLSGVTLTKDQINGIRAALSLATDEDLQRAGELLESYRNTQNGK